MKKLYFFNWCMFLVFIVSMCSLDNPTWTATFVMAVSGLLLVGGAYLLEQMKIAEAQKERITNKKER